MRRIGSGLDYSRFLLFAKPMRICIVAEHASYRFGGQDVLPLHYFSGLLQRRMDATQSAARTLVLS